MRKDIGRSRTRRSPDEICDLLGVVCDHCEHRIGVDQVGYFVHRYNWAMTCNAFGSSDATVNGRRRWP